MKRLVLSLLVLVAIGAGVGAYYMRRGGAEPQVITAQLTRGDLVDTVGATGTLEAVTTVQVGTQVSGTVQDLYADFNSIVKKGQIIARLDPSLIQTQIEQQQANVTRAEADLERLRVSLADARQKLERARAMSERNLIPRTDLETAEVNAKSAEAQLKSAEAALVQARASLNNQKVNLDHTVITAPIDGIVISRNVEPGQTVAASMQAPTLYVLAADLTKMQVIANIDEADVGRMRPGQNVTFRVDAYPTDTFTGTVQQVRLQPQTVQNVVTYSTVISVPNPDLKLKPGMTANVSIEIARRSNVLRIPNAALRFRPTNEMFAALGQEVPPEIQRGSGSRGQITGGGRAGQGAGAGRSATGQPAGTGEQQPSPQQPPLPQQPPGTQQPRPAQPGASREPQMNPPEPRGGGDRSGGEGRASEGIREQGSSGGRGGFDTNMSPEERRKRFEERTANMSPEERERMMARMREAGGRPDLGGRANTAESARQSAGPTESRGGASPRGRIASAPTMAATGATTIDSLFGPLPATETRGTGWLYMNKQLKPIRLRLGISDGTNTQILNDEGLQPGQEIVINIVTGLEPRTGQQQGGTQNPLMGPQRGRGGPGGFGGPGGGGGGGRGR